MMTKDATTETEIASTTKIMTLLLVIESGQFDQAVPIKQAYIDYVKDPRLKPGACVWTPPQLSIPLQACRFGFFVRPIRGV